MSTNILMTGAAGYIGGSIVADFLALNSDVIKAANISATVRTDEQARSLSSLGINVLQVDLTDQTAVAEAVQANKIHMIIHTASSIDSRIVLHLITALGRRREANGEKPCFIHTSGLSAFDEATGWKFGDVKDTDSIISLERQVADSYLLRKVDVLVTEKAKEHGVTSYIVSPATLCECHTTLHSGEARLDLADVSSDGRGTGAWNQLTIQLPVYIKSSISLGKVHKFAENIAAPFVHISDLTDFYARLVEKIIRKEQLPSGEDGYYFAVAHSTHWWDILDHLALALHARGLAEPATHIWPSEEMAAQSLGVPVDYARSIWNGGPKVTSEKKHLLGWQPAWDSERFLRSMDEEIQAAHELGGPKSSLLDSLPTSHSK
ncbi:Uu.00g043060.m01.CDS01 [Anthostomella pinea]|uniref:Uu.00g043060.m01.CDS01 n=1 Tax=Anthostomella pinea TaxID=933095 RepID=A0AAI8YEB3_9PEZI|nr:Uu.00g043060.m01.CDS01 [Anthostomella pinea]